MLVLGAERSSLKPWLCGNASTAGPEPPARNSRTPRVSSPLPGCTRGRGPTRSSDWAGDSPSPSCSRRQCPMRRARYSAAARDGAVVIRPSHASEPLLKRVPLAPLLGIVVLLGLSIGVGSWPRRYEDSYYVVPRAVVRSAFDWMQPASNTRREVKSELAYLDLLDRGRRFAQAVAWTSHSIAMVICVPLWPDLGPSSRAR